MNGNCKTHHQLVDDFSFTSGLLNLFGIGSNRIDLLHKNFNKTTPESSIICDWNNISNDIKVAFDKEVEEIIERKNLVHASQQEEG